LGRDVNFLRSDKQDSDIYRRLWEIISRGETWSGHLINKKKDGTLFEEEVTISPVRDDGGRIVNYVAVKRDVTRETQLEKQLRQAQKMEAIGTLAGGIAHDFNNILSAVMGFSELGLKRAVKGAPTEKEHREVMKAAERARDLIRHILTFSSKATIELSPLDLNSVVRHAMNMVERTIPKMINIRLNLAEKLSAINGNAGQLDQVLLNLCGNAADAMPDGGHLSVETRQITIRDGLCSATDKAFSGEFVLLEVSDTGQGMDDEVQGHIFDPFFTTKPVGKGTGLGLSTVFGIMQAHGGFITCQSRPDNGTLFGLYFPVSFAQIPSSETETLPPKESRKGKETILLVDDEAPLREIGQETLEYYGYRPLLAESGEEALAIYRECGSNIDLIILDISMPGMGGERCMKALLELNPMAKIIISSGYARDGQLDESLKARACAYLVKPYRFETLLTMVRSVLDNI
jgi:signal transduction histidine kinase/CheY-like chemotaxis protein